MSSNYAQLVNAFLKVREHADAEFEAAKRLLGSIADALRRDLGGPANAIHVEQLVRPAQQLRAHGESAVYRSTIEVNIESTDEESGDVECRVVMAFPISIAGSPVIAQPSNTFTVRVGEATETVPASAHDAQSLATVATAIRLACGAELGAGQRPRHAGRPIIDPDASSS